MSATKKDGSPLCRLFVDIIVVCALLFTTQITAEAASISEFNYSGIEVECINPATGTVQSESSFSVNVPCQTYWDKFTRYYTVQDGYFNLKNTTDYAVEIQYTISGNNKHTTNISVGDTSLTVENNYSVSISSGSTVKFKVSSASGSNYEGPFFPQDYSKDYAANYTITITSVKVKPVAVSALVDYPAMGTASVKNAEGADITEATPGTDTVTFKATANDGYRFVRWIDPVTGSEVSTLSEYSVKVKAATSLKAVFEVKPNDVSIGVTLYPLNRGTVTAGNGQSVTGEGGTITAAVDSGVLELTAAANEGFRFAGWLQGTVKSFGDISMENYDTATTKAITVGAEDQQWSAVFLRVNTYTAAVNDNRMGTASVRLAEQTEGSTYVSCVLSQSVIFKAQEKSGYVFEGWYRNGVKVSDQPEYTVVVEEEVDYGLEAKFRQPKVTISAGTGVSSLIVTANGSPLNLTNGSAEVPYGTGITASCTLESGYTFYHWYDSTAGQAVCEENSYTFTVNEDMTLVAFCKDSNGNIAGVCQNTATGVIYGTLEAGLNNAASGQTVRLIQAITVTKDITIPAGVTLLVPYSGNDTGTESYNSEAGGIGSASSYVLTVEDGVTVTVKGTFLVNAVQGQLNTVYMGSISGDYGLVQLYGQVNVKNGGLLNVRGLMRGNGKVTAESGATIYQFLEITDFRGGNITLAVQGYVFPINQFYIQNIQVTTELAYGSAMYGRYYIDISSDFTAPVKMFSSDSDSLFCIQPGGSVVLRYDESRAKTILDFYGNVSVVSMELKLNILYKMNTADYQCPLSAAFDINVMPGANLKIEKGFKVLPGATATVHSGGTLTISASGNLYLYDFKDYEKSYATGSTYRRLPQSRVSGVSGTIDETEDGTLIVNGSLMAYGGVYSSSGAGTASSSLKTTQDTGVIKIENADYPLDNTTIKETIAKDSRDVAFSSVRGLLEGGITWEPLEAGTYYSNGSAWYKYKVTYYENGTETGCDRVNSSTVEKDLSMYETVTSYSATNGATVSYDEGTKMLAVSNITGDTTVSIQGTTAKYTVSFVLNADEYATYNKLTGKTLVEITVNAETFYTVASYENLSYGAKRSAPASADMGITSERHNGIQWYLSEDLSGQTYGGTVPAAAGESTTVYIYGSYSGAIAYNSYTDEYYTTLAQAFQALPTYGSAKVHINLIADCGTYEAEPSGADTVAAGITVTLNLNGYAGTATVVNKGTLSINGGGGSLTSGTDNAITNQGTITEIVNTTVVTFASGKAAVYNAASGTINTIGKAAVLKGAVGINNFGAIMTIDGGTDSSSLIQGTTGAGIQMQKTGKIGTIKNVVIHSTGSAVRNDQSGGVIDELGDGLVCITTGSGTSAVYSNASSAIGKVTGGIYYSASAKALYCENTSSKTLVTGGYFCGSSPENAVYPASNLGTYYRFKERYGLSKTTKGVTYPDAPEGITWPTATQYYYIDLINPGAATVTGETAPDNGTRVGYATLAEAIAAYEEMSDKERNDTYITLMDSTTETGDIEVSQNLYLDLNGHEVNMNGYSLKLGDYTLYGMDASTNGFDASDDRTGQIIGTITHNEQGGVADVYSNTGIGANANKSYVTVTSTGTEGDDVTEFHRFAITPIACRFYLNNDQEKKTSHSHLEIKAAIQGDDTVIAEIQDLGFQLDDNEAALAWYGKDLDNFKSSYDTEASEKLKPETGIRTVSYIALTCDVTGEEASGVAKGYYETVHTITAMAAFDMINAEHPAHEKVMKSTGYTVTFADILKKYVTDGGDQATRVETFLTSLGIQIGQTE